MAFSAQRQRVTFAARCRLPVARSFFCQRVILLTDGQANHGIIDPAIFVKHAAELTEEGIATTTIGYGEDFNEALVTVLTGFPCRFCIFLFRLPPASGLLSRPMPAARPVPPSASGTSLPRRKSPQARIPKSRPLAGGSKRNPRSAGPAVQSHESATDALL